MTFRSQMISYLKMVLIPDLITVFVLLRSYSQALEDAFLAIDARITTEEVIKELVQIAGRPQEETEKVADEDDG